MCVLRTELSRSLILKARTTGSALTWDFTGHLRPSYRDRYFLSSVIWMLSWKMWPESLSSLFRGGTEIIAFSQLPFRPPLYRSPALSCCRLRLCSSTGSVSLSAPELLRLFPAPTAPVACGWKPNTHDYRPCEKKCIHLKTGKRWCLL